MMSPTLARVTRSRPLRVVAGALLATALAGAVVGVTVLAVGLQPSVASPGPAGVGDGPLTIAFPSGQRPPPLAPPRVPTIVPGTRSGGRSPTHG